MQLWVCTTKGFLHKLSETIVGKLICLLVILTNVLTWLQFGVVNNFISTSILLHSPMSHESIHNSWKLKMSQLFYGLHTHRTCHPLSMFGMLWIHLYEDGVPVPANIQQLHTTIEEEWDNIPQATVNSLISSMRRRCRAAWDKWWSHQILTGFLINTPTFF